MEEVNSCFLCKSLNLEANSVDISGPLLENIIRLKVLGDLPVDFPQVSGGKLQMCHDCLSVVDDIQSNLTKLKDRIVKRKFRVRYANVHFTKSQNNKISPSNTSQKQDLPSTSTIGDIEGEESEEEYSMDPNKDVINSCEDEPRRDSLNSVVSNVSLNSNCPSEAATESSLKNSSNNNYIRDVHIKVPSSVNATFIVVQSPNDISEYGNITNSNTVHSLLDRKEVSDVVTVPAFANAQHLDVKKRIDSPSVSTTRVNDESPGPVENGLKSSDVNDDDVSDTQKILTTSREPFKKRRQSFVGFDQLPKFRVNKHQSDEVSCRSPSSSPGTHHFNHNNPSENTLVPTIITPPGLVLDLSSHSDIKSQSPQLIPDENYQEYLNQRRRSYDVHYPAVRFEKHLEMPSFDILRGRCSPKTKVGSSSNAGGTDGTLNAGALSNSNNSDEPQKVFHCDLCGKVFERKGLWKRHMLSTHQDQAFTCLQCGMKFVDRMSLHIHESREHGHIAGSLPLESAATMPILREQLTIDHTNKEQNKVRKKMQYCEDCREHFTSKYDLLRHRVTTGHMGGAGGVCSDRGDSHNHLGPGFTGRGLSPYDALSRRPAPPLMKTGEVGGQRRFRRMESQDDSLVPYIKAEMEEKYYTDRRHSAGALLLNSSSLQHLRDRCDEGLVYSADGQQYTMKVTSSSDKDHGDRETPP